MFTKRHYIAIAETIRKHELQINKVFIIELEKMFLADNPKFSISKFETAIQKETV